MMLTLGSSYVYISGRYFIKRSRLGFTDVSDKQDSEIDSKDGTLFGCEWLLANGEVITIINYNIN